MFLLHLLSTTVTDSEADGVYETNEVSETIKQDENSTPIYAGRQTISFLPNFSYKRILKPREDFVIPIMGDAGPIDLHVNFLYTPMDKQYKSATKTSTKMVVPATEKSFFVSQAAGDDLSYEDIEGYAEIIFKNEMWFSEVFLSVSYQIKDSKSTSSYEEELAVDTPETRAFLDILILCQDLRRTTGDSVLSIAEQETVLEQAQQYMTRWAIMRIVTYLMSTAGLVYFINRKLGERRLI